MHVPLSGAALCHGTPTLIAVTRDLITPCLHGDECEQPEEDSDLVVFEQRRGMAAANMRLLVYTMLLLLSHIQQGMGNFLLVLFVCIFLAWYAMLLVVIEHNAISLFHLDRLLNIAWTALLERQISSQAGLIFRTIKRKPHT